MLCSKGHDNTSVIDTRPSGYDQVRRRRQCDKCGERFTTYERRAKKTTSVLSADDFQKMDKGGWVGKRLEQRYERDLDRLDQYDDNGILISRKPTQPVRKVWL